MTKSWTSLSINYNTIAFIELQYVLLLQLLCVKKKTAVKDFSTFVFCILVFHFNSWDHVYYIKHHVIGGNIVAFYFSF